MKKQQDPLNLLFQDIELYLVQYNVGRLSEFNFIRIGLNYSYLLITTTGKYIFRIYRAQWRTKEDICYEVDALLHISNYGAKASVPIATLKGTYINQIVCNNETLNGVLFSYAEGEIPQIDEPSSFALGKSLAEIHMFSDNFYSSHKRSYNINLYHLIDEPMSYLSTVIEKYLPKESCNFISSLGDYIKRQLSDCKLETGFCHGDLHDWNVHSFNKSYTVFDFDCCGFGFRAYDIAVFWWNLKLNYPEKEENCWRAFREGYESKKTISEIDFKAIPLFVMARRYWLCGILLKNPEVFGTAWINETGLNMFFTQLQNDVKNLNIDIL